MFGLFFFAFKMKLLLWLLYLRHLLIIVCFSHMLGPSVSEFYFTRVSEQNPDFLVSDPISSALFHFNHHGFYSHIVWTVCEVFYPFPEWSGLEEKVNPVLNSFPTYFLRWCTVWFREESVFSNDMHFNSFILCIINTHLFKRETH